MRMCPRERDDRDKDDRGITMDKRVELRLCGEQDIERLARIKTDRDLWEYEDDIPTDLTEVEDTIRRRMAGTSYRQYLICLLDADRTVIGELHIHWYVKERQSWELGYALFPAYRRKGYCIEAVRIALEYAFTQWGAHKVVAMVNSFNADSSKVLDRVGMKREGVFRRELPWRGQWADQWFYSLLEEEYHPIRSR